jgi:glutathione peroxidase
MSIYNYEYNSIEGKLIKMSDYQGKVLLIVNTASKCGFAPQYKGLQELYEKYSGQGLVVIGFPSNQFMEQEPGNEQEIANFCSLRYGVTFPLSQKVDVRDESAIPLFKYLTSMKEFGGLGKGIKAKSLELMLKGKYKKDYADPQIKWNFTKFLIDRQGSVFGRYEPTVEPKDMTKDIETLLK